LTPRTLAKQVANHMLSKKGSDIVLLDVRKLTSAADFFVICSADSDTQVKAIADAVQEGTEAKGERPWHSEGYQARTWIVVDYVDVVAHVFHKEAREFYNLERLWRDAGRTEVSDEGKAVETAPARKSSSRRTPAVKRKPKPKTKTAQTD
jgi:ribosome-associated protein